MLTLRVILESASARTYDAEVVLAKNAVGDISCKFVNFAVSKNSKNLWQSFEISD